MSLDKICEIIYKIEVAGGLALMIKSGISLNNDFNSLPDFYLLSLGSWMAVSGTYDLYLKSKKYMK